MSRPDLAAFVLALAGFLAALLVSQRVFEAVPHLEDEIAYVWQAEVIASGRIAIPSPPQPKSFLVPFVVDYEGLRFAKYPNGWPAVLALGVLAGGRVLVNPLLAGLGVWMTYLLGRKVFNPLVGLLAAGLTVVSPFFLMNSGSLLSHPMGLVLSAGFLLAWLAGFGERGEPRRSRYTAAAALLLGGLILTRPFTAVGVALPAALHGAVLFLFPGGSRAQRLQTRMHLLVLAGLVLGLASLHFLWQYSVTGDPTLNPYTLWWNYDRIGFGPGHGVSERGHTLRQAYINSRYSLQVGAGDLFGWGRYSWIFLPFGLWAARRNAPALLVGSVFPILVVLYLAYWVGADLFGPRYYYESLFSLTLFSAAGITLLAGWPYRGENRRGNPGGPEASLLDAGEAKGARPGRPARGRIASSRAARSLQAFQIQLRTRLSPLAGRMHRLRALRPWLVGGLLAALVVYSLAVYTPERLGGMYELYGISRKDLDPFLTAQAQELAPALFIVHVDRWMYYGALLEIQNPFLTTPFIFAWSRGPGIDREVADLFPERSVFHYYPEEPYVFYKSPRP